MSVELTKLWFAQLFLHVYSSLGFGRSSLLLIKVQGNFLHGLICFVSRFVESSVDCGSHLQLADHIKWIGLDPARQHQLFELLKFDHIKEGVTLWGWWLLAYH